MDRHHDREKRNQKVIKRVSFPGRSQRNKVGDDYIQDRSSWYRKTLTPGFFKIYIFKVKIEEREPDGLMTKNKQNLKRLPISFNHFPEDV